MLHVHYLQRHALSSDVGNGNICGWHIHTQLLKPKSAENLTLDSGFKRPWFQCSKARLHEGRTVKSGTQLHNCKINRAGVDSSWKFLVQWELALLLQDTVTMVIPGERSWAARLGCLKVCRLAIDADDTRLAGTNWSSFSWLIFKLCSFRGSFSQSSSAPCLMLCTLQCHWRLIADAFGAIRKLTILCQNLWILKLSVQTNTILLELSAPCATHLQFTVWQPSQWRALLVHFKTVENISRISKVFS